MDVELRHLRCFLAVVDSGGVSAAARRLGVAQSAVSGQLQRLERTLGTALLVRGADGVRTTATGDELARHARDVLLRMDGLLAAVRPAPADTARTIRLTSEFALAGLARHLAATRPDVVLRQRTAPGDLGRAHLAAGDADVCQGVGAPGTPGTPPGHERVVLVEEPMWVLLGAGHPLAGRPRVRLADLAGARWSARTAGSPLHAYFLQVCRAAGFSPLIAYEGDDANVVKKLCAAGNCISLASPINAPDPALVVRPLTTRVGLEIYFEWRTAAVPEPVLREILDWTRAEYVRVAGRHNPAYARHLRRNAARFPGLFPV